MQLSAFSVPPFNQNPKATTSGLMVGYSETARKQPGNIKSSGQVLINDIIADFDFAQHLAERQNLRQARLGTSSTLLSLDLLELILCI